MDSTAPYDAQRAPAHSGTALGPTSPLLLFVHHHQFVLSIAPSDIIFVSCVLHLHHLIPHYNW